MSACFEHRLKHLLARIEIFPGFRPPTGIATIEEIGNSAEEMAMDLIIESSGVGVENNLAAVERKFSESVKKMGEIIDGLKAEEP